jgi:rhamnosyltransferase subunit B
MHKPDIILCTLGTRGDINPFLSLARSFRSAGHDVTVLSNENWRRDVILAGAHFEAIAPADESQSDRDDYRFFLSNTLPSYSRTYSTISAGGCDKRRRVVVYKTHMLGAQCAAEKAGLPHIEVALQPSAIKSVQRPPWPLTALARGPWAPIAKRSIIPFAYVAGDLLGRYRRHANAFRRSVGLPPFDAFAWRQSKANATAVMCPAWFAEPQADWPANSYTLGFPADETWCADDAAARFIRQHGPALVFTPGTGVTKVEHFFARAESVCKKLERPGIFLSRAAPATVTSRIPILRLDFADLSWLLPRSAALIHHGGIGTTAQALRAGVPQIIIPDRFDQPDNAMRVAALGLGGAVLSEISSDNLAQAVDRIVSDPSIAARVRAASRAVRSEKSGEAFLGLLERVISDRSQG